MNLEDKLNKLPDLPGVYLMKDKNDNIIYIGKAKSLKKRVRQYFGSYANSNAKVKSMVEHIHDFEYIIVENEMESLILESNLIKDNHPKYNIILRDDKQYPYIKIVNERYPRVLKTRKILKDDSEYFGPYPAVGAVNEVLKLFEKNYKLRTCSLNLENPDGKYRPCLNYFIGKCMAPCQGNVDDKTYDEMIEEIRRFLSGKDTNIIKKLEKEMRDFSEKLDFEKAASIRDDIVYLKLLNEKQIISNTDIMENRDVIAMARGIEEILVQVFFIRAGKIIGREHYFLKDYFNNDAPKLANAFIKQFYGGLAFIPKEIVIESEPEELEILQKFLSEKREGKVKITVPQRGEKKDLLNMVKKNALDMLNKYGDRYKNRLKNNIDTLKQLQNIINLPKYPERIEAYDISNTYGIESVGSMVVFENGIAKKSDYRKFKIKSVNGPNDYESLKEVLTRRFTRGINEKKFNIESSFSKLPDLIMMDGGKGQINIAKSVLDKLNLDIEVCGLVKDDFHTTRGIIYKNKEYNMNVASQVYKMIYRIQEEAHRFAINYHRSRRSQNIFKSELDGIDNIGPKRKSDLMQHFNSIDRIKSASIDELLEVKSMNVRSAESIYNYFRNIKNQDMDNNINNSNDYHY
ncbi:excinuclease ABC subunit UvrC [Peptoniphilus catoniae]|uniref:excinuclease ABC subunit UvrC n=1 Tax=Peptoniphilus catoniae TaxID=1660341 RepID=UPI0010FD611A|nr:excinuclease ABC subunit UvrC [Peptoniphilus catoniae]